jgi:hypothetical protein
MKPLLSSLIRPSTALITVVMVMAGGQAYADPTPKVEEFRLNLSANEIESANVSQTRALAGQAYMFGLPGFLHYRQSTEIKRNRGYLAPNEEPFGGWVLLRELTNPKTDNTLPNVDTLYGANYVRLDKQGPVVLSIPKVEDRYYSVAIMDAYFNNIEIVGTKGTKGEKSDILILPPNWKGAVPSGFTKVVKSPTVDIAMVQRIYTANPADVPAVHKIQDQIVVAPLSKWKSKDSKFDRISTPEFDSKELVRDTSDPLRYFQYVNAHVTRNPPSTQYAALMGAFQGVGIGPGATLPTDPALRQALIDGAKDGQAIINATVSAGPYKNGWRVPDPKVGVPGPDYRSAAVFQITQISSLPPTEAMYFFGFRDGAGNLLNGKNNYSLTYPAGQTPPVEKNGFWSLTMYKASDNLLVDNPINRYIMRPTTDDLKFNADGSLTIYIANKQPAGTPLGNWLPAPPDGFLMALRTYLPAPAIQNGSWFPPAVIQSNP